MREADRPPEELFDTMCRIFGVDIALKKMKMFKMKVSAEHIALARQHEENQLGQMAECLLKAKDGGDYA